MKRYKFKTDFIHTFFQTDKGQDDELGEIVDVEFSDTDASDAEKLVPKVELVVEPAALKKKDRKLKKGGGLKSAGRKTEDRECAPTVLESSVSEVSQRLAAGCECQGVCYKDLQAENVYRHRLNIAELTKQEHDMYLMGVTMACLSNRNETNRHKERIRQRAVYVFQGKRVCLDAFIYLENVTQYHLKRIRRHVMINGVTPRVHGNVRKKPHNALSLDVYKFAENFVKSELSHFTNDLNKSIIVVNEPRINMYQKFRVNCPIETKTMSYSTFRHFLKKQFPHVRFVINRQMDNSRGIKQEKKYTKVNMHKRRATSSNVDILHTNAEGMIIRGGDIEADIENLEEAEEICVEFIAANDDDSYESDAMEFRTDKTLESKHNEYQDVDFLESDDD